MDAQIKKEVGGPKRKVGAIEQSSPLGDPSWRCSQYQKIPRYIYP